MVFEFSLRRHTLIDAFVKHTAWGENSKGLLVLAKESLVAVRESFDLVYVIHGIVGSIASNHSSCVWVESGKDHVFILSNSCRV